MMWKHRGVRSVLSRPRGYMNITGLCSRKTPLIFLLWGSWSKETFDLIQATFNFPRSGEPVRFPLWSPLSPVKSAITLKKRLPVNQGKLTLRVIAITQPLTAMKIYQPDVLIRDLGVSSFHKSWANSGNSQSYYYSFSRLRSTSGRNDRLGYRSETIMKSWRSRLE